MVMLNFSAIPTRHTLIYRRQRISLREVIAEKALKRRVISRHDAASSSRKPFSRPIFHAFTVIIIISQLLMYLRRVSHIAQAIITDATKVFRF